MCRKPSQGRRRERLGDKSLRLSQPGPPGVQGRKMKMQGDAGQVSDSPFLWTRTLGTRPAPPPPPGAGWGRATQPSCPVSLHTLTRTQWGVGLRKAGRRERLMNYQQILMTWKVFN